MPDQDKQNPTTGSESDISKSQSQQQQPNQASQQQSQTGERQGQFETGQQQGGAELTGDQAATGQAQGGARPDEGLQGDTLAQQRTDIEGASLEEEGEEEGGFVGSEGRQDTSSELVEDQDFEKGGQGAPEGK